MAQQVTGDAADQLPAMLDALTSHDGAIHLVYVFGHGLSAQVKVKTRKVGPVIIPGEGQTIGTILRMLADLVDGQVETERT